MGVTRTQTAVAFAVVASLVTAGAGVSTHTLLHDTESQTVSVQAAADFTHTATNVRVDRAKRSNTNVCNSTDGKRDVRVTFPTLPRQKSVVNVSLTTTGVNADARGRCEDGFVVWFSEATVKQAANKTDDAYVFSVTGTWSDGRDFLAANLSIPRQPTQRTAPISATTDTTTTTTNETTTANQTTTTAESTTSATNETTTTESATTTTTTTAEPTTTEPTTTTTQTTTTAEPTTTTTQTTTTAESTTTTTANGTTTTTTESTTQTSTTTAESTTTTTQTTSTTSTAT
ncbi:hypothetical protein [Halarchaeum sp. P4]|uniref:hypothetical protein n=1 Tax=Halarchaeum sp. P4 TaxID=3421639 RepID=UPI003EB897F7